MPMKPMSVEQCVSKECLSGLLKNRSRVVPGPAKPHHERPRARFSCAQAIGRTCLVKGLPASPFLHTHGLRPDKWAANGRIMEQAIGLITGCAEGAGDAEVRATPGLDADEADNNGAVRSDGRPASGPTFTYCGPSPRSRHRLKQAKLTWIFSETWISFRNDSILFSLCLEA